MPISEFATATECLAALAAGQTSSQELLERAFAQIDRWNGEINAVVVEDRDAARVRAGQADAARARGESWGPLHGLPMTIKDSFEVVGMPTTSGAPALAQHRPVEDADAVARLREAGAIPFGKTNLPIYAGDFQSYNEVYGTTNNPYDPSRGPGGSSGGSAAALAAGFTPLELGSDIGGSIRNPAHFCGVFGHKPSYGIVSSRGHVPGPPGALGRTDLAVSGPMARSAEDLELALDVLAAPAPSEARAWSLRLPPARHERLQDFRAAVWLEQTGRPVARSVTAALEGAVAAAGRLGARLDPKARPAFDVEDEHQRYLRLLWSVMGMGFPPAVLEEFDRTRPGLDAVDVSLQAQMIRGASGLHRTWLVDDEGRAQLHRHWARFFEDVDVVLCPIFPTPAFPHDHGPQTERTLDVDGQSVSYLDQIFWAGIATIANLPATVIPVGFTPEGLPVGLQIIGPYLEDRTPLRFAQRLAEELGGFVPPPRLV